METLIGFVAGYLVGANEGKGGLERLKASVKAIMASPEARRLIGEAIAVAGPVMRKASGTDLGELGEAVVRQIMGRAAGAREGSRAA
jgi:hypothetical protein